MQITIEHHGTQYRCDTRDAKSLAIELDFEGPQPNHFGADKASSSILKMGDFVGDTRRGGSCNVDTLTMVPHCNGTHTETISHIVNQDIWVGHSVLESVNLALLITVQPELAQGTTESYRPPLDDDDKIITTAAIKQAVNRVVKTIPWAAVKQFMPTALIIRTTPNLDAKRARAYSEKHYPPFFTVEAQSAINDLGVRHLLVDMPSVDRMYDDGLLTNHHLFWNVPEKSHELGADSWQDKTITEMIFVDDAISDGPYLLNLQVPALCNDAAPSRPVVFPITPVESSRE